VAEAVRRAAIDEGLARRTLRSSEDEIAAASTVR
jgi:hypothetical protein